jgi:hypothetical protein
MHQYINNKIRIVYNSAFVGTDKVYKSVLNELNKYYDSDLPIVSTSGIRYLVYTNYAQSALNGTGL